jgi:glucose-6-phosphate isomerase
LARQDVRRGENQHTEGRAVLHTALRAQKNEPVYVDGQDVIPAIRALHKKMEAFVNDVREENGSARQACPFAMS